MLHADITDVPDFIAQRPASIKNPNSLKDSHLQRKMFSHAFTFARAFVATTATE